MSWAWRILSWEVSDYKFNFFNRYMTIEMICLIWVSFGSLFFVFLRIGSFHLNCSIYMSRVDLLMYISFNVCRIYNDNFSFIPEIDNVCLFFFMSVLAEFYQFNWFFFQKPAFCFIGILYFFCFLFFFFLISVLCYSSFCLFWVCFTLFCSFLRRELRIFIWDFYPSLM